MSKVDIRCARCGRAHELDARSLIPGRSHSCRDCGHPLPFPGLDRPPPVAESAVPEPREVSCPRCGFHFTPTAPAAETGRRTVLVVEDMAFFRDAASDALAGKYRVKLAENVEEALRVLEAEEIDLMLLDLTLPDGQDGREVLRRLPAKPCPVIVYSAQDEADAYSGWWEQLRSLGVDDLVMKGMNVAESLRRKVDAILDRTVGSSDTET